jgi:glycerol-3-phosphate acyltransferase PlsY
VAHLTQVAVIFGAYLVGAIPFGLLVAKYLAGIDVRAEGSGNIGATNVARTAGKGLGLLTLALDALKGAAPPLCAAWVLQLASPWVVAAGLAAVLGHVFPVYLRFKGGKGVATAAGAFLAIAPISTLVAVLVFGLVFAAFRVVSLGSLAASLALVVSTTFLDRRPEVIGLSVLVATLVFVRHRANIRRLWRGEESKFKGAEDPR